MISVDEAKQIIQDNTSSLSPIKLSLEQASGLVLAKDILSPVNIPSFNQSSMDGYALTFRDWQMKKKLTIEGIIPAGSPEKFELKEGFAMRIFTGAPLPHRADTVVMQEKTRIDQDQLIIEDENLAMGINVRPVGMEIKQNDLVLKEGSFLNPAAIGLIASIGQAEVFAYPWPSVAIIITGDELQFPGKDLQFGQVYEANSFSLKSALEEQGIRGIKVLYAEDSLEILTNILKTALFDHDLIFLTGGISVGDFDFVLKATINNEVGALFHRIKQRPAKPLYFGKKGNKYVFGLPGNPASGLTSFYEYVLPALSLLCKQDLNLKRLNAPLSKSFKKPAGLTHFLKGYFNGDSAEILDAQESFRLSSFARANCLIKLDEEVTECRQGELVEIHMLPN
jgi:molybdopterin molybdotransferase